MTYEEERGFVNTFVYYNFANVEQLIHLVVELRVYSFKAVKCRLRDLK